MIRARMAVIAGVWLALAAGPAFAQGDARLAAYKADAAKGVDEMAKLAQEMVDSVFSFGELGFQEVETSEVPHRHAREGRLQGTARGVGHPHGVGGHVGQRASR